MDHDISNWERNAYLAGWRDAVAALSADLRRNEPMWPPSTYTTEDGQIHVL